MNQPQFQKRVGVFVFFCLVLMGVLLLAFSKGTSLFAPSYTIKMRLKNVGGLKQRSFVFLAGIQVGYLKSVELAPDGRSVVLLLSIVKKYQIHKDAEFVVEQIGVLGDQFVSIYPGANAAPLIQAGEEVQGHDSFKLEEVARSADDLLKQLSQTLTEVREGVTNVKRGVLDPNTLSNLSATVVNLRRASEHSITITENVSKLVRTNAQPITQSISNMVRISDRLEQVALHLDETILTNRAGLNTAVTNFAQASAALKNIADGLEAGQGMAGSLLKDTQLQANLSLTFSNLSILSSNLNRYGLLYKPRQLREKPSVSIYPGKRP
jgi:phospholipid/cholesterol/gamma-HCH transport system substrate-binding protein